MKKAATALAVLLLATPLAARGEGRSEVYQSHCAVCHGDDGRSQTEEGKKKGARDLSKKKWQDAVSDEQIAKTISKGREKMPSFAKKLTEDEIKGLVKEVRGLLAKS